MAVATLVVRGREHAIRCRGKQEHADVAVNGFPVPVLEQFLSELTGFVLTVQHVAEPLELVEDHQVGLE